MLYIIVLIDHRNSLPEQFMYVICLLYIQHATSVRGLLEKGMVLTRQVQCWSDCSGVYMYYCYFSSVFLMMVYTYLLLAGLLVTLLPSTFATSLYTRDRQAFGLCYEEDCLSAHFSYNPYGCHGKVSSIVHVNVQVIYLRSLQDDYF